MRYISKKAGQQFEQFFGNNPNMNTQREQEGSITIDKNPSPNSRSSKKVGEYVEYEEVD